MRVRGATGAAGARQAGLDAGCGAAGPSDSPLLCSCPVSAAEGILAKYPGKMLAYNCSPSFNWEKNLTKEQIATFQQELGKMGYKFQFVTLAGALPGGRQAIPSTAPRPCQLGAGRSSAGACRGARRPSQPPPHAPSAGYHALNFSMFELAAGYRDRGMAAYSELQQREFAREKDGYTCEQAAARHGGGQGLGLGLPQSGRDRPPPHADPARPHPPRPPRPQACATSARRLRACSTQSPRSSRRARCVQGALWRRCGRRQRQRSLLTRTFALPRTCALQSSTTALKGSTEAAQF